MTREEAFAYAISKKACLESEIHRTPYGYGDWVMYSKEMGFANAVISALRGPTREQVEKAWKGCSWCKNEGKRPENWECSLLDDRGYSVVVGDEVVWTNAEFCPVCGRPLTDKAVDLLAKKLEEVLEGME